MTEIIKSSETRQIWTVQMSQWRLARERNIEFMDITVKSGIQTFAPSWDNLRAYKDGLMSKQEYSLRYYDKVLQTVHTREVDWRRLLNSKRIALACYCRAGEYCHRHLFAVLAVTYIQANKHPVEFMGELLPVSK